MRISQFNEFSVKGNSGTHLAPISSVCFIYGTLNLFSKNQLPLKAVVYYDCDINCCHQVFLDIGYEELMSLFGCYYHIAAISDKGEVIFIKCDGVKNLPNSLIADVSLPDGKKALSVTCLENSIVVLSSNSRAFSSSI